jgi:hypothetical protein
MNYKFIKLLFLCILAQSSALQISVHSLSACNLRSPIRTKTAYILNFIFLNCFEREREDKVGGDGERHYSVGGGNLNKIGGFEGSQAVPASRSRRGEVCMRKLFNFNFKDVGAAGMGRNVV